MAKKLFYSMGEVSEMFDVNASLIRFWETKFDILRPQKNKKGNRLFSPADVENLKLIYHLVKERGMTLDGAARCLKQNKGTISRDAELLERLQRVRALLEEVRAELKESAEDRAVVAENGAGEAAEVSALPVRTRKKHLMKKKRPRMHLRRTRRTKNRICPKRMKAVIRSSRMLRYIRKLAARKKSTKRCHL